MISPPRTSPDPSDDRPGDASAPEGRLLGLTDEPEPALVGAKAAWLATAKRGGLPVPDGWVVPAEASMDRLDVAAAEIRRRLGAGRYAVRSSAPDEDGAHWSQAGRYSTELDVAPADLAGAIARVRADGGTSRVPDHVASGAGTSAGAEPIPVLVMGMCRGAAAGVAFGADPVSGDRGVVCIEAASVRGDEVVGGTVTPTHVRVVGDTVEQPPGPTGTGARGARAIGRLVREAEQILGAPADIEFVIDAEAAPTLLQLRPITSLADLPELPGSWVLERDHMAGPFSRLGATLMLEPQNRVFPEALADLGVPLRAIELRWVNGHVYQRTMAVGEPEPKPGTTKPSAPPPAPVLWLLARLHPELRRRARRARRTLARDDRAMLADAEARLTDLERAWDGFATALPAPGEQDDQALGATIQRTLGHLEESAEEHFRASIGGGAPMLGRWARTLTGHGFAPHEIATLLRGANGTRSLSDALTDAARAIARNESARRVLAAGTASSKTTDDASLAVEALTELIGRPLGDLRADHGPGGASYDLADPTLDEQPGVLLAGLSAALRNLDDAESPSGPDTGSTAPEVVAELRSRLERCDAKGTLIADLAVAQRWHALRENGNQLSFAQSGTLRRQLLELAERWVRRGRLHDARHLWNLDGSELRAQLAAWVDGRPTVVPADVPARRATQARRQARIAPPPYLGPPPGSPPDPSVFPPAMAELTRSIMWFANHAFGAGDPRAPSAPGSSDDGAHSRPVVQGRPGSAGTARGPVRVLSSPDQVAEVRDGDVLVCPYTNPNWTPALLCAAAVVTATGGALSHAAIVCRELGVPAVVGAPEAMAVLSPGQLVDVDGSTGTVTLVPAADRNDLGQAQFTAPPPPP